VFSFGPKPKFCSFDLDLDQAEQKHGFLMCGHLWTAPANMQFVITPVLAGYEIEKNQKMQFFQAQHHLRVSIFICN
jgi:hypothetical protein